MKHRRSLAERLARLGRVATFCVRRVCRDRKPVGRGGFT